MVSLQLAGLEPWPLFLSATVGNVVGSMFNYWIGTFGRMEWIEKYLHISAEKVNKTRAWIDGRGAWIGTLCFLPILGSVLSVTLGYMRANPYTTFMSISVGKAMRYAIIIISIYYINN
jgi:membrane protein YqaA with SNARE-associated domain